MKEKDFEVIVPAYDALESELEEILGGWCIWGSGNQEGGERPCVRIGEKGIPGRDVCCPGLVGEISGEVFICVKA